MLVLAQTCNSRIRGKLPVMEYGSTYPTISSVALHNAWKPRDSRLQATPFITSPSKEISSLAHSNSKQWKLCPPSSRLLVKVSKERLIHLPRRFSSGRTYFETGPRVGSFVSSPAFISSTYSFNFWTTKLVLHDNSSSNYEFNTSFNSRRSP